jgi:hypothetical protein
MNTTEITGKELVDLIEPYLRVKALEEEELLTITAEKIFEITGKEPEVRKTWYGAVKYEKRYFSHNIEYENTNEKDWCTAQIDFYKSHIKQMQIEYDFCWPHFVISSPELRSAYSKMSTEEEDILCEYAEYLYENEVPEEVIDLYEASKALPDKIFSAECSTIAEITQHKGEQK